MFPKNINRLIHSSYHLRPPNHLEVHASSHSLGFTRTANVWFPFHAAFQLHNSCQGTPSLESSVVPNKQLGRTYFLGLATPLVMQDQWNWMAYKVGLHPIPFPMTQQYKKIGIQLYYWYVQQQTWTLTSTVNLRRELWTTTSSLPSSIIKPVNFDAPRVLLAVVGVVPCVAHPVQLPLPGYNGKAWDIICAEFEKLLADRTPDVWRSLVLGRSVINESTIKLSYITQL